MAKNNGIRCTKNMIRAHLYLYGMIHYHFYEMKTIRHTQVLSLKHES